MKFFVPGTKTEKEAERRYSKLMCIKETKKKSNKRVWKLSWPHNGMSMSCEVGKPLPAYYKTGEEPVLAIIEQDRHFLICTKNSGGDHGSPVIAGHEGQPIYFD